MCEISVSNFGNIRQTVIFLLQGHLKKKYIFFIFHDRETAKEKEGKNWKRQNSSICC